MNPDLNLRSDGTRFTGGQPVWQLVVAALVMAVLVALLSAMQLYVNWQTQGYEAEFGPILLAEMLEWVLWAAVIPAILWLDTRFGFRKRGLRPGPFVAHALFGFAFLALHNLVMTSVITEAGADFARYYMQRFVIKLPGGLLVYVLILTGSWVTRLYGAYYRRSEESARLEAQLAEARFASLSSRLHPHFVFNTLHSIGHLVREGERDAAVDTLAELGELLRYSLDRAGEPECTLAEELELLRRYIRIQKLRFGDRLDVREQIDVGTEQALIPALLLQPLVENAIRHGLELDRKPGFVTVAARREQTDLVLVVSDNGAGFSGATIAEGVGLGSARERLRLLYDKDGHLEIGMRRPTGTEITLRLPFHLIPYATPAGGSK